MAIGEGGKNHRVEAGSRPNGEGVGGRSYSVGSLVSPSKMFQLEDQLPEAAP